MASCSPRLILLTGVPGVGKSTIIRNVSDKLKDNLVKTQGFYTEEERVRGQRIGFNVITLDNDKGVLARVKDQGIPDSRQFTVGKYNVCLQSFEMTALPTLQIQSDWNGVIVIDEIGKMELFSQSFVRSVRRILEQRDLTVLATVPVSKGRPLQLVQEITSRNDVMLYTVTQENRDGTSSLAKGYNPFLSSSPLAVLVRFFEVTQENRDGIASEVFQSVMESVNRHT